MTGLEGDQHEVGRTPIAHCRHGHGDQRLFGDRPDESVAHGRAARGYGQLRRRVPLRARQGGQPGAKTLARVEQHAHRLAGIGKNNVVAEGFAVALRLRVQLFPVRGIVDQGRQRQHVQCAQARIQLLVDRGGEVSGQVGGRFFLFGVGRAHAVDRHPRRQRQQRQHAEPDQPGEKTGKRHSRRIPGRRIRKRWHCLTR
ncbi:MAG: hypothetical protein HY777_12265 [Betaproteobacteria bacterium]|nr:hypothetical protein [Betaproteobacteria bacterium]